jgi:hypothetical protein
MREELDRAYKLIREGQIVEATAILESLIRENPDNEDAWWLLANASYAPDAKRNALNNIIRLTQNAERRAKASTMLNDLSNDPYSFDAPRSSDKEKSRSLQSKGGCGRYVLMGVGVLGLLACVGCFALFGFMMPYFQMPASFTDMGRLEIGVRQSASIGANDIHVYMIEGEAGQTLRITVRAGEESEDSPPFIILFDDSELIVGASSEATVMMNRMIQELPATGDYVVVVRPIFGIGDGDYSIEAEVIE